MNSAPRRPGGGIRGVWNKSGVPPRPCPQPYARGREIGKGALELAYKLCKYCRMSFVHMYCTSVQMKGVSDEGSNKASPATKGTTKSRRRRGNDYEGKATETTCSKDC